MAWFGPVRYRVIDGSPDRAVPVPVGRHAARVDLWHAYCQFLFVLRPTYALRHEAVDDAHVLRRPAAGRGEAADLEKAGIDVGWVPELYGFDAVSILGYLAAKTDTMELGSGIFNIYGRTPSTIAMTAAGLDAVSSGRFILGLGASGPQVIEGFHGVKYDKPLGRQRRSWRSVVRSGDERSWCTTARTTNSRFRRIKARGSASP